MSVLSNVKCRWASVVQPNTKFEPVWEIEAILDAEQAAMFTKEGATVKTDDDGNKTLRFKRKVSGNKRDGGTYENTPPPVVDMLKQPFDQLIGNGSTVNISYALRPWEMMGKSGISADLKAVQVVDLVAYSGGGGSPVDEFDAVPKVMTDDVPF